MWGNFGLVAGVLVTTGCAARQTETTWSKLGGSASGFNLDYRACLHEAMVPHTAFRGSYEPLLRPDRELYFACMQARGWSPIETKPGR
jgi:hypothetical protein